VLRALVFATLVVVSPQAAFSQATSVLHIRVVLADAERKPTPVARHPLLISDNPPTSTPRLIHTRLDGTADVPLRPGKYTVESDRPVTFEGKAYQWTQMVDISAGRDAVLELTADNAEVEPSASATTVSGPPLESDPSFLLARWQDGVVALWTATTRASGFVISTSGLIATSQRAIGTATSVEVQLTPAVKLAGRVLSADPVRDVAILRLDPQSIASVQPIPVPCRQPEKTPLVEGEEIFTIGVDTSQQRRMTSASVSRVDQDGIATDFLLARGGTGGPVFTARGDLVGITSLADEKDGNHQRGRGDSRVVRIEGACSVIASAEKKMEGTAPPSALHLPVEPVRPFPPDALKGLAEPRAGGSVKPYQISSASFDVAFITPVLTYAAQYQAEQPRRRTTSKDTRTPDAEPGLARAVMALSAFGNWSEYVLSFPPVLLVRVTPKLTESLWTKLARGAARTQGVSIPPIRRFTAGFSRLRALCGDAEVTPIHPFKIELRVSESDAIHEGLYAFDPDALGPQCGTVKLVLYSEKEPEKGEERVVDPGVVQQFWQDFAAYRAQSARHGKNNDNR
jgi:S1-C subfamily serine protease